MNRLPLRPTLFAPLMAMAAIFALSSSPVLAQASETSSQDAESGQDFVMLGIGALYYRSPFRGEESNILPVPVMSIKQGPFYIDGLEAGIDLALGEGSPVALHVQPFVAVRTVAGTTREKITADVGARISIDSDFGTLSGDYRHDATGEFEGGEFIVRYSVDLAFGRFTLTPGVQANFLDRDTANHIYGVSPQQSARFNRKGLPIAPYAVTRSATNLGGDITATYWLTERMLLIGNMSGSYLDRSIRSNPGLEDEFEAQALIGIGYVF